MPVVCTSFTAAVCRTGMRLTRARNANAPRAVTRPDFLTWHDSDRDKNTYDLAAARF